MTDPLEGKPLPVASLPSSDGRTLRSPDDFKGRWTVLYTYPKDDTPGCTKEACLFRDNRSEFERIGAQIFGLSLDDTASHHAFIQKFQLNFPLLTDADTHFTAALGSYGEQEWKGNKYMGLSRDTFVVDPNGVVRQVFRKVDPIGTMSQAREAIERLKEGA